MHITLRSVSWLAGAAALVLPGLYVAVQLQAFSAWASAQEGGVCGMPVLGIWLGAMALCALLSGLSAVLNGLDLCRSERPQPRWRHAELGLLATPAVCMVLFVAAMAMT